MKTDLVDLKNAQNIIYGFKQFENACVVFEINCGLCLGVVKVYKDLDFSNPVTCFYVSKKDLFTLVDL